MTNRASGSSVVASANAWIAAGSRRRLKMDPA